MRRVKRNQFNAYMRALPSNTKFHVVTDYVSGTWWTEEYFIGDVLHIRVTRHGIGWTFEVR